MKLLFFHCNISNKVFSFLLNSFDFQFQSSNMPLRCFSLFLLVVAGHHGQCSGLEVGGNLGDVHDEAGDLPNDVHDDQGGGEDHQRRAIDVRGFIEDVVTKHKRDIGGLNRDNDGLKKGVVIKHRHRPSVHKSYGSGSYVIPKAALSRGGNKMKKINFLVNPK